MNINLKGDRTAILLIALITAIFFGVCVKGNINIDDELIFNSLSDKPVLSDLTAVFKQRYNGSDYRPVVIFSFVVEQLIFGQIHLSYSHAINVFIYFLIGVMIYFFIQLISDKNKYYLALFTALIFIAHPVHSSVVSSLKCRDNLLSMLFGLTGLFIFVQIIKKNHSNRFIFFPLGIFFFILAVLSKLDAVGFFIMTIVYALLFYTKKWKTIVTVISILFLTFLVRDYLLNQAAESNTIVSSVMFDENPLVIQPTFINKIASASITLLYYTKFMIFPKGYYYYFGYNQIPLLKFYHPIILCSILLHLIILTVGLYNLKKNRLICFAILFYFITLVYCLNYFVLVAGIVADRYAFIASFGFCLLVGYLITESIENLNQKKNSVLLFFSKTGIKRENIKWILLFLILLFYFPFTFQRNKDWKNKSSLIEKDLPHLQSSFHAQRIASSLYQELAKDASSQYEKRMYLEKSNDACEKAIAVYDSNLVVWLRLASNEYVLGNKLQAYATIQKAIKINDTIPSTYSMLADIFYKENQYDSAKLYFEKSIYYHSTNASDFVKLTDILNKNSFYEEAIKLNEKLIKLDSSIYEPYQNLANTKLYMKDTLKATSLFLKAFQKGLSDENLAKGIQEYLLKKGFPEKINEYNTYLHTTPPERQKYIP